MTYSFDSTHAPELGGEPILDAEVFRTLEELAGDDDPGLVEELIGLFLEDSTERIRQIETGLSGADYGAIGAAAHALKSASANIGACSFSKACAEVEHVSRASDGPDSDAVAGLVQRTLAMYGEVCVALAND